MDFYDRRTDSAVARTARDFALHPSGPCNGMGEQQKFPHDLFKELGQLGLMGVVVPEDMAAPVSLISNMSSSYRNSQSVRSIGLALPPITLFARDISCIRNEDRRRNIFPGSLRQNGWGWD